MNTSLWYQNPAKSFSEALPIGNGRLGGMVYDGILQGKINLNLDTLWSGLGKEKVRVIPQETIERVRTFISHQEYYEAQILMEEKMLGEYNESYMPLGSLSYSFIDVEEQSIRNYKRELDLKKGMHKIHFTSEKNLIESEIFASYPDQIMAIRIRSKEPVSIYFAMKSDLPYKTELKDNNFLYMEGNAPTHVVPNYIASDNPIQYDEKTPGMPFGCLLKFVPFDGNIIKQNNGVRVSGFTELCIYLAVKDGFRGYDMPLLQDENIIKKQCYEYLQNIQIMSYETIKKRHVDDYKSLFNKVNFELGEEKTELPTDQRLALLKKGEQDIGLYCLFFHYGRYLMIASSREGTQPANLQGIWNDSIRPIWSSNWTVNINTQMNYWPIGICNLLECNEPLLHMVSELSRAGKETAEKQFHCGGWVCNHNVDLWRQTTPVGGCAKYAYWPMGGVWLANQLYCNSLYLSDEKLLKDRVFPILKEASRFCVEWLQKGKDGYYHTIPSTSPENSFWDEKKRECYVLYSSTMDISLIQQLFEYTLEMYIMFQVEDGLKDIIMERKNGLPSIKISKDGEVCEWQQEVMEVDSGHRHFSPLIGFHMKNQIKTENLIFYEACERLIEKRVKNGSGHIGWSCAWLVSLYAKLENSKKSYLHLKNLLCHSLYDNLLDLHPPLGENDGEREVFQIDGNFGGIYGIATMLMNDCNDIIELLPALPEEWKMGKIEGLLTKKGFICSIWWNEGTMQKACFLSRKGSRIEVRYGEKKWIIEAECGKEYWITN